MRRRPRPSVHRKAEVPTRSPSVDLTPNPVLDRAEVRAAMPPPMPSAPAPGSLHAPALTHRHRLLAQAPDLFAGGTMRVVSAREFPISTPTACALLTIKPEACPLH